MKFFKLEDKYYFDCIMTFQKYWPKKEIEQSNTKVIKMGRRGNSVTSIDSKKLEQIRETETGRSTKDVRISQCPDVNAQRRSSVSSKASVTASSKSSTSNKMRV